MFEQVTVARPGELMEIDSTPFDVMVRLDDGVAGRAEMTGLIDLATRSITAALLRPSTKSVDAALLLARTVTPAPMRPGWPDALRMEYSALPYRRLLAIDDRLRHAAAVPVIIPETIVIDGGAAFVQDNFSTACDFLGAEIIHVLPRTPTQKPHIERTLESAASLFAQYVAGYTGPLDRIPGPTSKPGPCGRCRSFNSLLEEWISAWQNRPHDGLRDPLAPSKAFTPNEKYAALVETAGYLPLPLSAGGLPGTAADPMAGGQLLRHQNQPPHLRLRRTQPSATPEAPASSKHKDRWEIRYDPYDIRLVWLRNHHHDAWITVPWRLLSRTATPFGELAWDHAARDLRESGGEVHPRTDCRSRGRSADPCRHTRLPCLQPKAAPATKRSKRRGPSSGRAHQGRRRVFLAPARTAGDHAIPPGGNRWSDRQRRRRERGDCRGGAVEGSSDAREEAKRKWW